MPRNHSSFFVLFLLFGGAFASSLAGQTQISCGEKLVGELAIPGEQDRYVFSGTEGEAIQVAGEAIDRPLQAEMVILDPFDNEIGIKSIARTRSGSIRLPETGEYTILVRDFNNINTGRYALSLQFTSGRCAQEISCGSTESGNVSQRAEQHAYRFSASADESIRVAALLAGNLKRFPTVEVFDPSGSSIGSSPLGLTASIRLLAEGQYTLILSDFFSFFEQTRDESFSVNFQFTTGRCGISVIDNEPVEQRIAGLIEQDSFSFEAVRGNWIHVESEALDYATWQPEVRVFDPLGIETSAEPGNAGDFLVQMSGSHTALVLNRRQVDRRYRTRIDRLGLSQFPVTEGLYKTPLNGTAVSFNPESGEIFVVYSLDLSGFGDFEIYGQRIDANTFDRIGDQVRISDMGPELNPSFTALQPDVTYSVQRNEYLVVWSGEDGIDGKYEIYGQRLDGTSVVQIGTNDFPISSTGAAGTAALGAHRPKVAYNEIANRYFVVWHADAVKDNEFGIYGRNLDATGVALAPQTKLNKAGAAGSIALNPDILFDSNRREYLAVWQGGSASSQTADIFGLQLNGSTANPIQSQEFKITSRTDTSLPERTAPGPVATGNPLKGEYLVSWAGSDGIIYGQRLAAETAQTLGPSHFPISLSDRGSLPQVEFNPEKDEYLVIWERELFGGKTEIVGQRISGDLGLKIDRIGFRISEMGPVDSATFGAYRPALVLDSLNSCSIALWDGNTRSTGGNQVIGASVSSSKASAGRVRWLLTRDEAGIGEDNQDFRGIPTVDADGSVYILGGFGVLSKLNSDGVLSWMLTEDSFGSTPNISPVVTGDGTLLLAGAPEDGSSGGQLKAYSEAGIEQWSFPPQEQPWIGLAIDDQTKVIYGAKTGGGISAINIEGATVWEFAPEGRTACTSPIVSSEGQILIGMKDLADPQRSFLYALRQDGSPAWICELDWSIGSSHLLARGRDGTTYVGGSMIGAVTSDGALKWTFPAGEADESKFCAPLIGKSETVFCGSGNAVQAFSPEGSRLFLFLSDSEEETFSKYAAIGPDGTLYALSTYTGSLEEDQEGWGKLHAIDAEGNLRWKIDFPNEAFLNSGPLLGDGGALYVISDRGHLYSIRTDSTGRNDLGWPMVGHDSKHTGQAEGTERHQLNFAQFADGAGALFSQIVLFNPDETHSVSGKLILRDDSGEPLTVDINGTDVSGEMNLEIQPGSTQILATDSQGTLVVGSASVESNRRLGGVLKFGGSVGLAGVGNSTELSQGFFAPMESNRQAIINTGVALMNLSDERADLDFELYSMDGKKLADAAMKDAEGLPAKGHSARFVDQFSWTPSIDFADFVGLLRVVATRPISATVIQSRPGEFATMPVSPSSNEKWGKLIGRDSNLNTQIDGSHHLYFAQFAEGGGALFSQIVLFNPDDSATAAAIVSLKDDQGNPMTVDLNGALIDGSISVTIPPSSMQVLKTDGFGEIVVGSATVDSNQPLSGVIVFGGTVGLAGVGSSPEIAGEFLAPMQTNSRTNVNTGIALMNLSESRADVDLELLNTNGEVLGHARLNGDHGLAPGGHRALFVDQFDWDQPIDFTDFSGLLKVSCSEPISATVIQTSPGQFATMPVVVR